MMCCELVQDSGDKTARERHNTLVYALYPDKITLTRVKIGIGDSSVPILVISGALLSKTSTPSKSPNSSNRSIPVACSSL